MTDHKHTPGPWRMVPWHVVEGDAQVRSPDGWIIAHVSSDENAALIARAPDLQAENERLRTLLGELFAKVNGECPALLDEDRGGDAQLCLAIEAAMKREG